MRSIIRKIVSTCKSLDTTFRLGNRSIALKIQGRYPASDFAFDKHSGQVIFHKLGGIALDTPTALELLDRYPMVLDLYGLGGLQMTKDNGRLLVSIDGTNAIVENGEELLILHEIFVEMTYAFSVSNVDVIMDIGANVGLASLFFARRNPKSVVYSYEPFTPTFEQARRNLKLNGDLNERIHLQNVGLYNENSTANWKYSQKNRGSCGLFSLTRDDDTESSELVEVKLRSIVEEVDDLSRRHDKAKFVAKIDCEGSEYAIINVLVQTGRIHRFDLLMIEWHKRGGHEPAELIKDLDQCGFGSICFPHVSRPRGMIYAFPLR